MTTYSDNSDSLSTQVLQAGLTISGFLSAISTGGLIAYFWYSKVSRTFGFKLAFHLFLNDFIFSLTIFIPCVYLYIEPTIVINEFLCQLQAFLQLFTSLASYFIPATITWTIYSSIVKKKPIRTKNPTLHFIGVTTVLPFVFALIFGHLKPLDQVMCFMTLHQTNSDPNDIVGLLLRVLLQEIPFLIVLIFDLVLIAKIAMHMRVEHAHTYQTKDTLYLIAYPIVFFFSWVWLIVERVIEATTDESVAWLNLIDLPLATLCGFLNAIVYGYISLKPFSKRSISVKQDNPKANSSQEQKDFNIQGLANSSISNEEDDGIKIIDLSTTGNDLTFHFTLDKQNTAGTSSSYS